jgi:hypothetical protein
MNLFPEKIKIGGVNHEIQYCDKFSLGSSSVGIYNKAKLSIRILLGDKDSERSLNRIHETLLHEILHGIDNIYIDSFIPEGQGIIERLSVGLYSVLTTEDLKLTNPILPKTIRINNINYKIICPYVFMDEPSSDKLIVSAINYEGGLIYFNDKEEDGTRYPASAIKSELLSCIIYVILRDYCISDEVFGDKYRCFINGLYQVLVDNNLDKLFLEGARKGK